jgi:hypothetical protein
VSDPGVIVSAIAEAAAPVARASCSVKWVALKDSMVPAIWKVASRDGSVCGLDGGGSLGDGGRGDGSGGVGDGGGGGGRCGSSWL